MSAINPVASEVNEGKQNFSVRGRTPLIVNQADRPLGGLDIPGIWALYRSADRGHTLYSVLLLRPNTLDVFLRSHYRGKRESAQ